MLNRNIQIEDSFTLYMDRIIKDTKDWCTKNYIYTECVCFSNQNCIIDFTCAPQYSCTRRNRSSLIEYSYCSTFTWCPINYKGNIDFFIVVSILNTKRLCYSATSNIISNSQCIVPRIEVKKCIRILKACTSFKCV